MANVLGDDWCRKIEPMNEKHPRHPKVEFLKKTLVKYKNRVVENRRLTQNDLAKTTNPLLGLIHKNLSSIFSTRWLSTFSELIMEHLRNRNPFEYDK